jgi:quercetin dioxygenase-like cupin family protein
MPFIVMDEIEKESVTPKYSTACGELVTGEQVEVGRLSFAKDTGAVEHAHPHEQVLIVPEGTLRITMEGGTFDAGPFQGFHAPPDVPHRVEALEDTVVIGCKGVGGGVGHKMI